MEPTWIEVVQELDFPQGARRLVDSASERCFLPGDVISEEGTLDRENCLVVEGTIEIVKGQDEMLLSQRHTGELVGEMAFLEEWPRSATVRAVHTGRTPGTGCRAGRSPDPRCGPR